MPTPSSTPRTSQIDQICEKVERLLVQHEELRRSNHLLRTQVETLVQQRDALESRVTSARARIDALLDRLPTTCSPTSEPEPSGGAVPASSS